MELAPTTTIDPAPVPVDVDVRAAIVDELLTARAQVHAGEVRQVWMAVQWALAHPAQVDADGVITDHAGWGEPRLSMPGPLVPLAGPGAPLVHPLAPLELAAALDRSPDHAMHLLGDALELAFRLPRLWALVQEGAVPVWLARQISRETHDLSYDAAAHADRLITAVPDKVARVDARRLIHEARLTADPDRAIADEEEAMSRRGVWLRRDRRAPGVIDVTMSLDADDADLLDTTLDRVAADLRDLGDTTSREIRRATAVGILADPQHALDLMSGRTTDVLPGSSAAGGDTDLVVHLTPTTLATRPASTARSSRRPAGPCPLRSSPRGSAAAPPTTAASESEPCSTARDARVTGGLVTVAARPPRPPMPSVTTCGRGSPATASTRPSSPSPPSTWATTPRSMRTTRHR